MTNAHLRLVVTKRALLHKSVKRWELRTTWDPDPQELWRETWLPYRSAKENAFLWQLLYHKLATQQWRAQALTVRDVLDTFCTRCTDNAVEDIYHCIWG
jgi:hypothetical protein